MSITQVILLALGLVGACVGPVVLFVYFTEIKALASRLATKRNVLIGVVLSTIVLCGFWYFSGNTEEVVPATSSVSMQTTVAEEESWSTLTKFAVGVGVFVSIVSLVGSVLLAIRHKRVKGLPKDFSWLSGNVGLALIALPVTYGALWVISLSVPALANTLLWSPFAVIAPILCAGATWGYIKKSDLIGAIALLLLLVSFVGFWLQDFGGYALPEEIVFQPKPASFIMPVESVPSHTAKCSQ